MTFLLPNQQHESTEGNLECDDKVRMYANTNANINLKWQTENRTRKCSESSVIHKSTRQKMSIEPSMLIPTYIRFNGYCPRKPGFTGSSRLENLWDKWHRFFKGQTFFLSSNQHCQNPEENTTSGRKNDAKPLVAFFLHPLPDSWWNGCSSFYASCPMSNDANRLTDTNKHKLKEIPEFECRSGSWSYSKSNQLFCTNIISLKMH